LTPLLPSAAGKSTVNVGVGSYGGETALGMTFAHRLENIVFSGGVGVGSGSKSLVKVGAGFEF
jgi:trimeric autotransporter adhesin